MSEQIKLTDEEITQIKQIQDDNARLIFQLGEIELESRLIGRRVIDLDTLRNTIHNDYAALQSREKELVQQLNTKYGVGQVDLESGVFIAG